MLAKYGYVVIGVDTSQVGIAQMLERAKKGNLAVTGVVADIYKYELHDKYDAVYLIQFCISRRLTKARSWLCSIP